MSQISILGFTPASSSDASAAPIHWAILVSPLTTGAPTKSTVMAPDSRPKTKSAKSFFRRHDAAPPRSETPVVESALFDMHNHQLRQQPFPVPLPTAAPAEEEADSSNDNTVPSTPGPTTTTIISSPKDQQHHLVLRVKLAMHHNGPQKLAPKVSEHLYSTPTYGPEDDWLLAALDELIAAGLLESTSSGSSPQVAVVFDADAIVQFCREAVKERPSRAPSASNDVYEVDYAAHVAKNAEVKAMFSPPGAAVTSSAPSSRANSVHRGRPLSRLADKKFLGFRIAPSPGAFRPAPPARPARPYWERQDDPYGGLM